MELSAAFISQLVSPQASLRCHPGSSRSQPCQFCAWHSVVPLILFSLRESFATCVGFLSAPRLLWGWLCV